MYAKAAGLFFLVTLLLALSSVLRKAPDSMNTKTKNRGSDQAGESQRSEKPGSTENPGLDTLMNGRKASARQLRPGFNSLPEQPGSPDRPFSSDFHKLPAEYFTPQSPESIRNAAEYIKDLQKANLEAGAVRQNIIHDTVAEKRAGQ